MTWPFLSVMLLQLQQSLPRKGDVDCDLRWNVFLLSNLGTWIIWLFGVSPAVLVLSWVVFRSGQPTSVSQFVAFVLFPQRPLLPPVQSAVLLAVPSSCLVVLSLLGGDFLEAVEDNNKYTYNTKK